MKRLCAMLAGVCAACAFFAFLHGAPAVAQATPFDSSIIPGGMDEFDLEKAGKAYNEGRYEEAAHRFESIIKIRDYPMLRLYLGLSYYYLGRYKESEKQLALCSKLLPSKPEVLLALAQVKSQLGKNSEAAAVLEKYMAVKPGDQSTGALLGALYISLKKFDKAEPLLARAVASNPGDTGKWFQYSLALYSNNKKADAGKALKKCYGLSPGDPALLRNIGILALKLGDNGTARGALKSYADNGDADLDVLNALGVLTATDGNYTAAEGWFRKALAKKPGDKDILKNIAACLVKLGKEDEASKLMGSGGDNALAYTTAAQAAIDGGDYAKAEQLLRKALAKKPGEAGLMNNLAVVLIRRGKKDEAIKLLSGGRGGAQAQAVLGVVAAQDGHYDQAEVYFRKSLAARPDDKDTIVNFAVCLAKLKKNDDALGVLEKAAKKFPGDSNITYSLASMYSQMDKGDKGMKLLETYTGKYPKNKECLSLLASMYESTSNYDKGIAAWRKYLELDPKSIDARSSLAMLLKRADKKDEALREYLAITAAAPGNAEAWRQAGLLMEDKKDTEKARAHYEKMVKALPGGAFAPARLGLISEAAGDKAAAGKWFDTAISKGDIERQFAAYTHRAKMLTEEGRALDAEIIYRQGLLSILEHSKDVYTEIMAMIQKSGGSLDLAKFMEISEREKGLDDELSAAMSGVYDAFAARGDTAGAAEYFKTLADQYNNNKQLLLFMASHARDRGEADEVLRLTDKILKIDTKEAKAHLLMAWAYEVEKDPLQAGQAYRRAIEVDAASEEAWNGLIKSYKAQGRYEELAPLAKRKYDESPHNAQLEKVYKQLTGTEEVPSSGEKKDGQTSQ